MTTFRDLRPPIRTAGKLRYEKLGDFGGECKTKKEIMLRKTEGGKDVGRRDFHCGGNIARL
jgi:hypothetical protein